MTGSPLDERPGVARPQVAMQERRRVDRGRDSSERQRRKQRFAATLHRVSALRRPAANCGVPRRRSRKNAHQSSLQRIGLRRAADPTARAAEPKRSPSMPIGASPDAMRRECAAQRAAPSRRGSMSTPGQREERRCLRKILRRSRRARGSRPPPASARSPSASAGASIRMLHPSPF